MHTNFLNVNIFPIKLGDGGFVKVKNVGYSSYFSWRARGSWKCGGTPFDEKEANGIISGL